MKFTVKSTDEQKLLSRKAVTALVVFEKTTPSNADIKKQIAGALKVSEDVVAVKGIYTIFGHTKADVFAYVYESKEMLEKFEPKKRKKKKKKKKKK